jgi:drug/metabolite transporter (DMT)-like permease
MSPVFLTLQTILALLAFAGNSVLCRLALNDGLIDANSFTIIRLISGAIILIALLFIMNHQHSIIEKPNLARIKQAAYLFVYAACFSIAYLMLGTAAGALILFVCVQLTMLLMQYIQGRRSTWLELGGLVLALSSFAAWMIPSAQRPEASGVLLMAVAGIAWGFYTITGKASQNPQKDTAQNFFYSIFFCIILLPLYWLHETANITSQGILLAVASGAIMSGLGYWLWYKVLPSFTSLSAGVMQLSVPILAAIGGMVWNHEAITLTFMLASSGILGGIFLVLYSGYKQSMKS